MPYAELDRLTLYYETSGPEHGDPLVLIHGLGAQMIAWFPGFCAELERQGFRLIRFDNRDVGLSQKFSDDEPYTVSDMAADVRDLLDHLGLRRAHVAGQSMGGMIAQTFAIEHPERLLSLCSIYSTPSMEFRVHDEEAELTRGEPPAAGRDEAVEQFIRVERISGLAGFSEAEIRTFAENVIDRNYCPEGRDRQIRATSGAPDRRAALAGVTAPTLVLHGREDRLLSWLGGVATAEAVPGAELHVYSGMGHQIPPRLWSEFAAVIRRNADRAADPAGDASAATAGPADPERVATP